MHGLFSHNGDESSGKPSSVNLVVIQHTCFDRVHKRGPSVVYIQNMLLKRNLAFFITFFVLFQHQRGYFLGQQFFIVFCLFIFYYRCFFPYTKGNWNFGRLKANLRNALGLTQFQIRQRPSRRRELGAILSDMWQGDVQMKKCVDMLCEG